MDQTFKAAILGLLLSILIISFSPVDLNFIPPFLVTIFAIAAYRISDLKDGLVVSFMIYLFTEGILDTVYYAGLYLSNEVFPSFTIDILTMLTPIIWAVTALIAGYVGVLVAKRLKPVQKSPTSTTLPPPPPPPTLLATP